MPWRMSVQGRRSRQGLDMCIRGLYTVTHMWNTKSVAHSFKEIIYTYCSYLLMIKYFRLIEIQSLHGSYWELASERPYVLNQAI